MCCWVRTCILSVIVFGAVGWFGAGVVRAQEADVASSTPKATAGSSPSPPDAKSAEAWALEADSDRHRHRGFYTGLKLGGGYRSFEGSDYTEAPADGWSATGGGVGVDLSLGWAIIENLVLHGDLVSSLASNPTLTVGDSGEIEAKDVTARLIGFGAGLTYFIMPLNVYVEGTLLASSINIDLDGTPLAESGVGIGGRLQAGKQFWVGSEWAVDVGPSFHLATMRDKGGDGRIVGWAANLLAGVSYN